jgi:hypothetical protein
MIPLALLGGLILVLALTNSKSGHAAAQSLDAGIPSDVAQAVATAILIERKPQNLQAFANSLLPDYPKAHAALVARSTQL